MVKEKKHTGNKWLIYETEKAKIDRKNLSTDEYESEIKKLCERLKI